jgi:hypothetical protein
MNCTKTAIGGRGIDNLIEIKIELRGARWIAKVKQSWSVIGWVTKNLLSQAPLFFGRHVKSFVPDAFAVVNTQPTLGPRGRFWPVLIMCNP